MKRFLIVDDDESGRLMLSEILAEFADCDGAGDGTEGLQLFEKALAEGRPYDLLCVDLIMPSMNGLTLVRKIREREKIRQKVRNFRCRIFVITASDSPCDKAELIREYLCDDYIIKPYDRTALRKKMVNLYGMD